MNALPVASRPVCICCLKTFDMVSAGVCFTCIKGFARADQFEREAARNASPQGNSGRPNPSEIEDLLQQQVIP